MKFKVGDVVRSKMRRTVNTVAAIISDKKAPAVQYKSGGWDYEESLELVERAPEADEQSDLASLVQQANDGMRAIKDLLKHRDQVQYKNIEYSAFFGAYIKEFFINPALPAPFRLEDSGHEVRFEDKANVKVGCVEFNISNLQHVLKYYLAGDMPNHSQQEACKLFGSRNGLVHSEGYMTWADAEQLLRALTDVSKVK